MVAWLDDDHVAAVQRVRGIGPSLLRSVDLRTGAATDILRYPRDTYGTRTELATDLLATPTVTGVQPPRPLDPRWAAGGAALLALSGAARC